MHFRKIIFYCLFCFPFFTAAQAQVVGDGIGEKTKIIWEVRNRFSPFEIFGKDAAAVFKTYRIDADDVDLSGWHKRLAEAGGVTSPFKNYLEAGKAIHWDPETQRHSALLTRFVRQEKSPSTTVSVAAHVVGALTCRWAFETQDHPCGEEAIIDVPLTGLTTKVVADGETLEVTLKPDHKVILAVGDSYGAGEGNPDVPAVWKSQNLPGFNDLVWLLEKKRHVPLPERRWVDDACHRSFFSFQSLAALKLASNNPHSFVSFFHYACTGAEVFDGVIAPQYQAWGKGQYVPYSQVNAALRDFCQEQPTTYEKVTPQELGGINIRDFHRRGGEDNIPGRASNLAPGDPFDKSWKVRRAYYKSGKKYPHSGLFSCDEEKLRSPDYLFVSIGGNDIGFADIIGYALVPLSFKTNTLSSLVLPTVCPAHAFRANPKDFKRAARYCAKQDRELGYHTGDLIGAGKPYGVARKLDLLFRILEHRFHVQPEQIVLSNYPDPLRLNDPTADTCSPLAGKDLEVFGHPARVFDPASPWNGLKTVAGDFVARNVNNLRYWQFNLTKIEALNVLKQFEQVRREMGVASSRNGITFICDTRDAYRDYGWWRGAQANLPNTERRGGPQKWQVADWDPYPYVEKGKGRALRTSNDSVLTQPTSNKTHFTGTGHPNLTGTRLVAGVMAKQLQPGFAPSMP